MVEKSEVFISNTGIDFINHSEVRDIIDENKIEILRMSDGAWYNIFKEIMIDGEVVKIESYVDTQELPNELDSNGIELVIEIIEFQIDIINRRVEMLLNYDE